MLRNPLLVPLALAIAVLLPTTARSGEDSGGHSCTDPAACASGAPVCKATWREVKTRAPAYSITCEYAGVRDADCWCAKSPGCRCTPPPGKLIIKKRLYASDGEETVERAPKYEVAMQEAEPCDCARCRGVCFWNPLAVLHYLLHP